MKNNLKTHSPRQVAGSPSRRNTGVERAASGGWLPPSCEGERRLVFWQSAAPHWRVLTVRGPSLGGGSRCPQPSCGGRAAPRLWAERGPSTAGGLPSSRVEGQRRRASRRSAAPQRLGSPVRWLVRPCGEPPRGRGLCTVSGLGHCVRVSGASPFGQSAAPRRQGAAGQSFCRLLRPWAAEAPCSAPGGSAAPRLAAQRGAPGQRAGSLGFCP